MDENKIKELLYQGLTCREIAIIFKVQTSTISAIKKQLNLPSSKMIKQINNHNTFKDEFIEFYNSTNNMNEIYDFLKSHKLFKRKKSIENRLSEIRSLLKLFPKMYEHTYVTDNDRIRGYIIRNSKYTAIRRDIYFDLKYTDFEIPEYFPILNIKLSYMQESDGNSPHHATLDRIDNSNGYVKGNVIIMSRLANSMKNQADFNQLTMFCNNIPKLINHYKNQGALGSITDVFDNYSSKLSLDS